MPEETDPVGPNRRLSDVTPLIREFPPLLNIEHQELIRAVERAQVNITAHRELFDTKVDELGKKLDDRYVMQTRMLDERYATQTKALDAAFLAQQAAMTTAFSAAEKAVQAALLAAEKAVEKANNASEKRFEAVNEFRGQLGDMQTTLMPRTEGDAKFKALDDRLTEMKSTLDKGFSGLSAVDENSRWQKGANQASYAGYYALAGVGLTIVIVVVAIMNLVTRAGG